MITMKSIIFSMLRISFLSIIFFSCQFFKSKSDDNQVIIDLTYKLVSFDNSFSIEFPSEPEYSVEDVQTEFGILQNHMYMLQYSKDIVFIIAFADYPDEINTLLLPDEIVKSASEGFTSEIGLDVQEQEKVKLQQRYSGYRFIASNEYYWCYMTNYYVPNRLYQLGILCETPDIYRKTAENFINSFRLL